MRKKYFIFLMTSVFCFALNVQAEENSGYELEQGKTYELNLPGDSRTDQFSFETYTVDEEAGEAKAVLELYLNGSLTETVTEEDWSYYWKVSQCPLEGDDGRTYLLVSSISDNDWSLETLLLQAADNGFETVADLAAVTRQETEETDHLLSSWARASAISAAEGNTFTVDWYETFRATGAVTVSVTYVLKDGEVSLTDTPCMLDETKEWTAWTSFEVMKGTEGEAAASVAYQINPGDVVHLTEFAKGDGKAYLKCVNQDGEEGWMPDAEEYASELSEDGENFRCGYFEEAVYAG